MPLTPPLLPVWYCRYYMIIIVITAVIIININATDIIIIVIAYCCCHCVGRPGAAVSITLHSYLPVHLPIRPPVCLTVLPQQVTLLSKGRQA